MVKKIMARLEVQNLILKDGEMQNQPDGGYIVATITEDISAHYSSGDGARVIVRCPAGSVVIRVRVQNNDHVILAQPRGKLDNNDCHKVKAKSTKEVSGVGTCEDVIHGKYDGQSFDDFKKAYCTNCCDFEFIEDDYWSSSMNIVKSLNMEVIAEIVIPDSMGITFFDEFGRLANIEDDMYI